MTKLSIIVPCYNVEKYIKKSIKSLINQTLDGIEIIAVDDGSKDNTGKILDELAKDCDFLKVYHVKNGGVSKARNFALKKAKGDYITFLDSDDWVKKNTYKKLYEKAIKENLDIVAMNSTMVYPDHEKIVNSNINDGTDNKKLMLNAYAVLWNKIYKKELIKGISFNEKLSFCEDVLFLYQVYSRATKVGSINEAMHYYLQRPNSLTYSYDEKIYHLIYALDDVVDYYKNNSILDMYYEEIEYSYVRYLYATFIKRLAKCNNKKEFIKGYNFVRTKVNERFPNYKQNSYLKSFKGFYLKYFNRFAAIMVYYYERNKMN